MKESKPVILSEAKDLTIGDDILLRSFDPDMLDLAPSKLASMSGVDASRAQDDSAGFGRESSLSCLSQQIAIHPWRDKSRTYARLLLPCQ